MKRNSIFLVNSTHKTKTWWMFLSVLLFVMIPFIIVWVLVGEFNVIDANWLVAKNASVWHGTVTEDIVDKLVDKYHIFVAPSIDFRQELMSHIGKSISIDSYKTFFNPLILAPLLGLFVWSICSPMLFSSVKLQGLDVLPFSTGFGGFMMVFIINALIPQWKDLLVLYWIVRLLIGIVFGLLMFIISNALVNKYLSTRPYAADIIFGYKISDSEKAPAKQQLQNDLENFSKDDKTYIDVPTKEEK